MTTEIYKSAALILGASYLANRWGIHTEDFSEKSLVNGIRALASLANKTLKEPERLFSGDSDLTTGFKVTTIGIIGILALNEVSKAIFNPTKKENDSQ